MRKMDTNDIIAVIAGSDESELHFATKDGRKAFILANPLKDGTRFITLEGDEREGAGCVHVHGMDAPLVACNALTGIHGENDGVWELAVIKRLAGFWLRSRGAHRSNAFIEGKEYSDGWYELEDIPSANPLAGEKHDEGDGASSARTLRSFDGEIIGVRFADDGETVLHVKLDDPDESIRHCRVRIECIPE